MAHKVTRALVSVSDKTGLTDLCRLLTDAYKAPSAPTPSCANTHQIEILSTGGTAKALRDAGIPGTLHLVSWRCRLRPMHGACHSS